ncbi:hypothetical protein QJQ45_018165 [Haematococcus lacustris]|nr:hypothetical protein QJQ45_018165 [Haematococcus lacustris]
MIAATLPSTSYHRWPQGFAGELDYDAEMAAMERGTDSRGSGRGGRGDRGGQRGRGGMVRDRGAPPGRQQPLNKKRQARDAKFGHGGAKRLSKQNDAVSAADMDGYRPSRTSRGGGQGGRGRGGARGGRGGGSGRGGGRGGGRPSPGGVSKAPMKRPGKSARAGKQRGGKSR